MFDWVASSSVDLAPAVGMPARAPSARQFSAATALAYASTSSMSASGVRRHADGEAAAEGVAGAGAVDAVDLKRRRADLAAAAPGQAALAPSVTHTSGAELARHRLERAPEVLVAGQRGREILGGDDRVDVLQQVVDAGPDLLDVDRPSECRPRARSRAACVAAAVS